MEFSEGNVTRMLVKNFRRGREYIDNRMCCLDLRTLGQGDMLATI